MITSLEEAKIYFNIWQSAKTDAARFNCLLQNKTRYNVTVDNDMVYVTLNCDEFINDIDGELIDSVFCAEIENLNEEMNPFSNYGYILLNEIFVSLGIKSDLM